MKSRLAIKKLGCGGDFGGPRAKCAPQKFYFPNNVAPNSLTRNPKVPFESSRLPLLESSNIKKICLLGTTQIAGEHFLWDPQFRGP